MVWKKITEDYTHNHSTFIKFKNDQKQKIYN